MFLIKMTRHYTIPPLCFHFQSYSNIYTEPYTFHNSIHMAPYLSGLITIIFDHYTVVGQTDTSSYSILNHALITDYFYGFQFSLIMVNCT